MEQAVELARLGLYTTMPNPRVGCLLVKDDSVIGRGWHELAGKAHAEVNAVADAKVSTEGASAYVTLEPCSHFGKTPPCSNLLIQAGIKKVFVAMTDPNPLVAGTGIKCLEDAGIKVFNKVLSKKAHDLNLGYIKRMQTGLPLVRCKMAMSLDARTAMASGESQWITGAHAREKVQRLRAQSCAVITGIDSILCDDASLTVRENQLGDLGPHIDRATVLARQPLRVVLDSNLRIPHDAKILSQAGKTLIATAVSNEDLESEMRQRWNVEFVHCPDKHGKIDLKKLLQYLAKKQCNEVLIETGAKLAGGFLQQNLIDEFIIFMAPKIMGSKTKGLFEFELNSLSESHQLRIKDIYATGEDWCIEAEPKHAFQH